MNKLEQKELELKESIKKSKDLKESIKALKEHEKAEKAIKLQEQSKAIKEFKALSTKEIQAMIINYVFPLDNDEIYDMWWISNYLTNEQGGNIPFADKDNIMVNKFSSIAGKMEKEIMKLFNLKEDK